MRMSRRGALIAVLAGVAGGSVEAQKQKKPTAFLNVQLVDSYMSIPDSNGHTNEVNFDYVMRVEYKDRSVNFTGDEIMDILEGKGL